VHFELGPHGIRLQAVGVKGKGRDEADLEVWLGDVRTSTHERTPVTPGGRERPLPPHKPVQRLHACRNSTQLRMAISSPRKQDFKEFKKGMTLRSFGKNLHDAVQL
jgi:hypothetical protein